MQLRRLGLMQVHAPTSNRSRLLRSQLQQLGPITAQLVLRGTKARALMAWELEGLATLANAAPSLFCVFLISPAHILTPEKVLVSWLVRPGGPRVIVQGPPAAANSFFEGT